MHNTEYEVLNTEEDGPVLKKVGSSSHNMQSVPFAIAESKDLSPILIGKESLANRSSSYHIKPDQRTTFVETPSSVSLRSNYDRKEEWEIEVESQGTSLVRSSSTTEADTLSTTTDTNDVKPSKVNASTPAAAWADSTLSSMSGSDDKSTRPASVQGIELSDMRTESSSVGGGPRQGAAPHRGSAGSVRGSTSKRDSKLKDISATRKLEVSWTQTQSLI